MGLGLATVAAAAASRRLVPEVPRRRDFVSPYLSGVGGRAILKGVEVRRRAPPIRADHLPLPGDGEGGGLLVAVYKASC